MIKSLLVLCLSLAACASAPLARAANPIVVMRTSLGDIKVELYADVAPQTVNNFLGYVDRNDYDASFLHRSVPGFVIQGGGYRFVNGNTETIPAQAPVVNEFNRSNLRGTIAMAKLGSDPNSATNQFFFNLGDNSANLDNQNGGFTVFGKITDDAGLIVIDAIAALQVVNAGSPFDTLPVRNYTAGAEITLDNLVVLNSVSRNKAFFDGEAALGNGAYYLSFPNGNYFGYYSYLADENYLFHYDMGYEYVFDANDGQGGVYLYDFKSNGFFYTSRNFPFPYLYDFTLNSVVYYYPDVNPNNPPGHYNTDGTRFFYVFNTGQIISK